MARNATKSPADELDKLYVELLHFFYEEEDRARAAQVAERLEAALRDRPDFADSIRGEEVRSLLAELHGDLSNAIRSREREVRKILELHSLAVNTPSWDYVQRQYDYSDVSDRLDLLAMLYAEQGDIESAIRTLHESRQFCESHHVPFDGQDLLEEYEELQRAPREQGKRPNRTGTIDKAVREAYSQFGASVDTLLVDDEKCREFIAEVNRRLPDGSAVSPTAVKQRLLVLRRRGAAKGGLPRLRK
jgi:hypothetical protein